MLHGLKLGAGETRARRVEPAEHRARIGEVFVIAALALLEIGYQRLLFAGEAGMGFEQLLTLGAQGSAILLEASLCAWLRGDLGLRCLRIGSAESNDARIDSIAIRDDLLDGRIHGRSQRSRKIETGCAGRSVKLTIVILFQHLRYSYIESFVLATEFIDEPRIERLELSAGIPKIVAYLCLQGSDLLVYLVSLCIDVGFDHDSAAIYLGQLGCKHGLALAFLGGELLVARFVLLILRLERSSGFDDGFTGVGQRCLKLDDTCVERSQLCSALVPFRIAGGSLVVYLQQGIVRIDALAQLCFDACM